MLNRLRLVTFDLLGTQTRKIGIHVDKHIVDLAKADSSLPSDAKSFLAGGQAVISRAAKIVESGQHRIPLSSVAIKAPIYNPEKVVCVG